MKIKIGSDELILWMRKNRYGENMNNEGANGLGFIIARIMENLNAYKVTDKPIKTYWHSLDDLDFIGEKKLPNMATQYEIEISKLADVYKALMQF